MELQEPEIAFLEGIQRFFGEGRRNAEQYPALTLAYIGDGVYDLVIRTIVIEQCPGKVNTLHRKTSSIVKAEAQAAMARAILGELTEEEAAIYRHGRNAKASTSAKNASITDYRMATGLEALIGYLYLKRRLERALNLIQLGLERTGQLQALLTESKGRE